MENNISLSAFRDEPDMMFEFMDFFFHFKPRKYQEKFLRDCLLQKRIAGLWSRQSGKSTTISIYCGFRMIISPTTIIISAPSQTQSSELYSKIRCLFEDNEILRTLIKKSSETEMVLKNGSRVKALPSGPEGKTILGFTADIVIVEEAGRMKDEIVNRVLVPMIASKGNEGQIIKIGTPFKRNHFYSSCFNPDTQYSVTRVTWKDCVEEGQYTQDYINEQRANCVDVQFKSEYEAAFIEELTSMFPISLVESCVLDYKLVSVL